MRGHVDFVGELAGIAHPEKPGRDGTRGGAHLARADGEKREDLVRHVDVDDFREHEARGRAGHRGGRPLLGHRRHEHLELRPVDLQQHFEMLQHPDGVDRRRRHQVVRRRETRHRAVVEHDAVVAQHHAIAAAADGERVPAVDVDAIQEFRDVLPLQFDLAQRRYVDDPDVGADIPGLAKRRIVRRFAGARIRVRTLPESGVDEPRAVRDDASRASPSSASARDALLRRCPGTHPARPACKAAGTSSSRRSAIGNPSCFRQQREPDDVGQLALVGAHAERRVALEMLDGAVAFARGERDVVDGDVVLPVDEAFGSLDGRAGRSTAAASAPLATGAACGDASGAPARKPACIAAAIPAACPSSSATARSKCPLTAPAGVIGAGEPSGTNVASASS